MSQEKVIKKKQGKLNRKQQLKIERRNSIIRKAIASVVGLALVAWIGISSVNLFIDSRPRQEITVDYTAVENFINELAAPAK